MVEQIKTPADQGIEIVSEVIEEAVNRVKRGDIVGIAVTFLTRKRGQEWLTGGTYSTGEMVGALELTKNAVIKNEIPDD